MGLRTDRQASPAARWLRPAVGLLAAAAILGYLAIATEHLRYPFELEWIEGAMVDEARRLAGGGALYVAPSLDYVPFIYAPAWFWAAAAFMKVFGPGFFAARLVSYLASIGAIALVGAFVRRELREAHGGSLAAARLPALAAAGLFAATYPIAAAFYDLARVDSLFVVLLLGGLYLARFHATPRAAAAAGLLFALATLTKQSGVIVMAPVALHLLVADRRRGLTFAAVGGAVLLGAVVAYDRASDGWFWHYVVALPAHHPKNLRVLWDFWFDDLLGPLGVACLAALFYLVGRPGSDAKRFHLFAAAGMLGAALAGRLHLGGWTNVLSPAYAEIAILAGVGFGAALGRDGGHPRAPGRAVEGRLQVFLLAAACVQLAALAYDPRTLLPSRAHAQAWRGLVAAVASMPGDVFVPAHGFVGPRAGKRPHAHQMAISDELRSRTGDAGEGLRREIRKALRDQRFAAMVIDNDWLPKEYLDPAYERQGEVPARGDLGPVIGWKTAEPQTVYIPRPRGAERAP